MNLSSIACNRISFCQSCKCLGQNNWNQNLWLNPIANQIEFQTFQSNFYQILNWLDFFTKQGSNKKPPACKVVTLVWCIVSSRPWPPLKSLPRQGQSLTGVAACPNHPLPCPNPSYPPTLKQDLSNPPSPPLLAPITAPYKQKVFPPCVDKGGGRRVAKTHLHENTVAARRRRFLYFAFFPTLPHY